MIKKLTVFIFAAFTLPFPLQMDFDCNLNLEETDKYLNNMLTNQTNILIDTLSSVSCHAIRN